MSSDIFFSKDVADRLDALDRANLDALALALGAGADRRELQTARFVYKSALDHMRLSLGLHRPDTLTVPQLPVATRYVFSNAKERG